MPTLPVLSSIQIKTECLNRLSLKANCSVLHEEVNIVADSFYSSVDGVESKLFAKHPVFFVYVDYSEAMAEYFRKFQISGVPFFSFVPASTESTLKIKPGSGDIDSAEALVANVAKKLQVPTFAVQRPILPYIIRTVAAALGIFVFVKYVFPVWYKNPFNPMLAFFVAMGVFFLSMAGLVFNLIRSPPYSGAKKNGEIEYIMGGSRSQYVVEGIIIASLMLIIAVAHIAINEIGSKRLSGGAQRVLFYVSFAVYVIAANTLWRVFCVKYGFYPYNVSFQLPAPLQQLIPF
jgi:hypothetical protein